MPVPRTAPVGLLARVVLGTGMLAMVFVPLPAHAIAPLTPDMFVCLHTHILVGEVIGGRSVECPSDLMCRPHETFVFSVRVRAFVATKYDSGASPPSFEAAAMPREGDVLEVQRELRKERQPITEVLRFAPGWGYHEVALAPPTGAFLSDADIIDRIVGGTYLFGLKTSRGPSSISMWPMSEESWLSGILVERDGNSCPRLGLQP